MEAIHPEPNAEPSKTFEIRCGLTIAVFAAVLAITDLFGGKYGDDEIKVTNEKASAFMWYQSKSIKETMLEGQRDLLEALRSSGAITASQVGSVQAHIRGLGDEVQKYKREKKEILLGSSKVGEANWSQEINGEKGKVIGAEEWAAMAERFGRIGDRLDLASLFLQLCLVMGAVSLVLHNRRSQLLFYSLMVALGGVGTGFTLFGLLAT